MALTDQIERALVGSLLHAPDTLTGIIDTVKATDFSDKRSQLAFTIITGMWLQKQSVNLVTVVSRQPSLATFLSEVSGEGMPPAIKDFARQVSAAAKERRINDTLRQVLESKAPASDRLEHLLELYRQELHFDAKAPGIRAVVERFVKVQADNRKRGSVGIRTGFHFLDEKNILYCKGHIWVIGGYTSTGKTAMAVQQLSNLVTRDDCPRIVIISTEMTEAQIISRLIANLTGIPSYRILSENFQEGEKGRCDEWLKILAGKPLTIHDDLFRLSDIENAIRKASLQGGVDVAVIDYVQNIHVPGLSSNYESSALAAKRLQQLAKDCACTLICLSQVSNSVGRGETDQLELKGAGEWAAVADVGVHIRRDKSDQYTLLYQVKKNRHGPLVKQEMAFKADFTKIEVKL